MSSFKKARNAVAMAYDASWIDDEEFVLLYDACYSKNPEIVHKEYQIFDLEELDETECQNVLWIFVSRNTKYRF